MGISGGSQELLSQSSIERPNLKGGCKSIEANESFSKEMRTQQHEPFRWPSLESAGTLHCYHYRHHKIHDVVQNQPAPRGEDVIRHRAQTA